MATLVKEFNQSNLVPIDKATFSSIRQLVERGQLTDMSVVKGASSSGDKSCWVLKRKEDERFFLVEHYQSTPESGVTLAYKCDKTLLESVNGTSAGGAA